MAMAAMMASTTSSSSKVKPRVRRRRSVRADIGRVSFAAFTPVGAQRIDVVFAVFPGMRVLVRAAPGIREAGFFLDVGTIPVFRGGGLVHQRLERLLGG